MKTRVLSGFLAVVGGGAAIVGCFEPTSKVSAEAPRVVTAPPTTSNTLTQPIVNASNTPAVAAVPTTLSPGVSEVARLFQSNVSEDVLLAYINNYGQPFYATADEILYLNDLGVSDNVITAVLKHKSDGQPTQNVASTEEPKQQAQAAPAPAPAPQAPIAEAPLVPQAPAAQAEAVAVSAPSQQVTVNYFYDTLSPYGTWVETSYGRCWRPAVIIGNPNWRPYCDRGHWIYTNCGWYWVSDYSWGWATFHYGRWCTDVRYGWVWVPDCEWGPSWVSWRYTSDYCGWAPLPPSACYRPGFGFTYRNSGVSISFDFGLTDFCYTFVPVHRFCDPHPYRYCAPRSTTTVIYKNSTVINNYIVNKNSTTIINEGVGRTHIEKITKQPVQTVAIHEMPKNGSHGTPPDRIHKVGKELVVYKPQAPEAVKPKFTPASLKPANNAEAFRKEHGTALLTNQKEAPQAKPVHPVKNNNNVVTTPVRPENNGHQSPRVPSSENILAPKVVNQPTPETAAKPIVVPNRNVEVPASRAAVEQPKHGRGHSEEKLSTQVAAPKTTWQAPVATTVPQIRTPQQPVQHGNAGRGNGIGNGNGNGNREAVVNPTREANVERGNSGNFQSPRVTAPLVPTAPAERSPYSSPRSAQFPGGTAVPTYRNEAQANSPAPSYRTDSPAIPRSNGQPSHGQGSARVAAGQQQRLEVREKLAERDSDGPGNGQGRGRGRY